MKNSIYTLTIFFLLISFFSCKEEYIEPTLYGNLRGEVLNAEDFTPLENVSIKLSPSVGSLLTDEFGIFELDSLEVGSYTVEIKKAGFDTELMTVDIQDLQMTEINVLLEEDLTPNEAPSVPSTPFPENFAVNQSTNTVLAWETFDNNPEDSLTFTVYLFAEGEVSDMPYVENWTNNYLEINNLEHAKTYFWQVIVSDGEAAPVYGPIWRFSTIAFPDYRLRWARKVNGKFQIFASDTEGNELQLTNGTASCWRPKISPDRSQVAFISNADVDPHIYVMDADGGNISRVTNIPISGINPLELDFAWSPDGNKLLYMNNDRLFTINKDGSGLTQVATAPSGKFFAAADWTEQGDQMIVRVTGSNAYDSEIFLLDENTGMTKLVEDEAGKTGNPVFSLDGTKIIYTHDIAFFENLEGRQLNSHILMMDLTTGHVTDLSITKPGGTNDLDPRFTPNGAQVIFTNTDNDGISVRNIYKVDLDGENRELIAENAEMVDWK